MHTHVAFIHRQDSLLSMIFWHSTVTSHDSYWNVIFFFGFTRYHHKRTLAVHEVAVNVPLLLSIVCKRLGVHMCMSHEHVIHHRNTHTHTHTHTGAGCTRRLFARRRRSGGACVKSETYYSQRRFIFKTKAWALRCLGAAIERWILEGWNHVWKDTNRVQCNAGINDNPAKGMLRLEHM